MLPRTWLTTQGAIGPVDGNVYSALPSFVEAAFAHLMVLRHDTLAAAYACQWWAALCTVITAFVVARLARTTLGAAAGATTALLFLGVPWIIVIGSLAYNDIAPCLFLAGGWLIIIRSSCAQRPLDARAAAALALVAAAAVGAKPTAFFFTALPLLAIVLMHNKVRVLRFAPLVVAQHIALRKPSVSLCNNDVWKRSMERNASRDFLCCSQRAGFIDATTPTLRRAISCSRLRQRADAPRTVVSTMERVTCARHTRSRTCIATQHIDAHKRGRTRNHLRQLDALHARQK